MRGKGLIGPVLGVAALLLFLVLPPFEPLTPMGMRVIGIFLFTMIWWATVGIGYPSLICLALFAMTGVMTPKVVFASSWGNHLIMFTLSVFGLAEALRQSGFSRRFALWFVTRPFARGRPWIMIAMFLLATTSLGTVLSGTATCITSMAIAEPMLEGLGYRKGDRFGATFMMGISWAATAAYIMTPIGHASNLLLIEWIQRDVGYSISFFQWLLVGVPMGILFYFLILGYLRFAIRPDVSQFTEMATGYVSEESAKMGSIKLEEKLSVAVFLGIITIWILPGVAGGLLPALASYLGSLGYSVPPLIGACLLCLMRVKGKPLLTFRQWMGGAAWGTIALIAAIMALKEVIGDPETGIPQLGAAAFEPLATGAPFFVYRFLGQLWVTIQTNLMSNMVSATLVYTIMVPAAIATGLGNQAALGWAIFAGARAGFALPSATTNTALVTGSGWVPIPFMARHGFIVSIGMVLLCVFVAYPWASFILR